MIPKFVAPGTRYQFSEHNMIPHRGKRKPKFMPRVRFAFGPWAPISPHVSAKPASDLCGSISHTSKKVRRLQLPSTGWELIGPNSLRNFDFVRWLSVIAFRKRDDRSVSALRASNDRYGRISLRTDFASRMSDAVKTTTNTTTPLTNNNNNNNNRYVTSVPPLLIGSASSSLRSSPSNIAHTAKKNGIFLNRGWFNNL